MATKPLPPQAVLKQLLRYEPDTGRLFWLPRGPEWFKDGKCSAVHSCNIWNGKFAGKEAFTALKDGYRVGNFQGRMIRSHRIIWVFVTGREPEFDIDHISGNRSDNRSENLRSVDRKTNTRNSAMHADNTSGHIGVYWKKTRWQAKIQNKHIGSFATKEEAITARKWAQEILGFHENHGKKRR